MSNEEKFDLPSSGLAEDILAQFIRTAQVEVNQVNTAEQKDRLETLLHLVTFQLGKEEYGVEIASVQEIIRATDITPVPGAPSHVRARFALPQAETSDSQRIVVVELCQKRIGMLVDSVSQVIKVPAGVVEEMPEEATSVDGNYIKGVGKLENRLVVILDLNKSLLLS